VTTQRQKTGAFGETHVTRDCACPRYKSFVRLPNNFKCADIGQPAMVGTRYDGIDATLQTGGQCLESDQLMIGCERNGAADGTQKLAPAKFS
jgi:hypothetical protein